MPRARIGRITTQTRRSHRPAAPYSTRAPSAPAPRNMRLERYISGWEGRACKVAGGLAGRVLSAGAPSIASRQRLRSPEMGVAAREVRLAARERTMSNLMMARRPAAAPTPAERAAPAQAGAGRPGELAEGCVRQADAAGPGTRARSVPRGLLGSAPESESAALEVTLLSHIQRPGLT